MSSGRVGKKSKKGRYGQGTSASVASGSVAKGGSRAHTRAGSSVVDSEARGRHGGRAKSEISRRSGGRGADEADGNEDDGEGEGEGEGDEEELVWGAGEEARAKLERDNLAYVIATQSWHGGLSRADALQDAHHALLPRPIRPLRSLATRQAGKGEREKGTTSQSPPPIFIVSISSTDSPSPSHPARQLRPLSISLRRHRNRHGRCHKKLHRRPDRARPSSSE